MLIQLFTCGCMIVAIHATTGSILCSDLTGPVAVFKSATINKTLLNLNTGKYVNITQRAIYERLHNADQVWQTYTHIITSHSYFNGSTRIISDCRTGNSTTAFVPRSSHWIRENVDPNAYNYETMLVEKDYIDRRDRLITEVVEYRNKTQEFKAYDYKARAYVAGFVQDGKPYYGDTPHTRRRADFLGYAHYSGHFQEINNSICHVAYIQRFGGIGNGGSAGAGYFGICYECENIAPIHTPNIMQWDKCSQNVRPDHMEDSPIPRRDRFSYFDFQLYVINPRLVVATIGARLVHINNQSYIRNRIVKFRVKGEDNIFFDLQTEDVKPHNYIGTLQQCDW